jgi:hypothetical protein
MSAPTPLGNNPNPTHQEISHDMGFDVKHVQNYTAHASAHAKKDFEHGVGLLVAKYATKGYIRGFKDAYFGPGL